MSDTKPNETPAGNFSGASVASATGFEGTKGFGSTSAPGEPERPHHVTEQSAGAQDESIPVTRGNAHLVIGATVPATKAAAQSAVGGPGTDTPAAGLTRTAGEPVSAVEPVEQVGNTVILPETTADETKDKDTGLPKPRTDVDADPHEVTTPAFQGLDRVNPLAPPAQVDRAIEHRGNPNEPRVVNVQSVGEPPVRVIGSESNEAKSIHDGMSPEDAQRESQHPSTPNTDKKESNTFSNTGSSGPGNSTHRF